MGERTSTRRKRQRLARQQSVRICEAEGCSTVLSIYNSQTLCALCGEKAKAAC